MIKQNNRWILIKGTMPEVLDSVKVNQLTEPTVHNTVL